jgi:predicted extracellular nuclease
LKKNSNISKVFIAMGEGIPPDIIGMAEIENDQVLKKFCFDSPLKKYDYHYIHFDSPDSRGVDVGLLYRKNRVTISHSEALSIIFPFDSSSRNRDILYVVAHLSDHDSIHIFVNHWTSRYGGYAATIIKRNYYAAVVRAKCEEILAQNEKANIIIMGDFNDYPTDESMQQILNVKKVEVPIQSRQLYNLMSSFSGMENIGTHKHEDFWGCLDQIIVSSPLLQEDAPLHIIDSKASIFSADFLLVPDEKYGGSKVYRTFLGPRYIGGYADHLPVFLELKGTGGF